MPFLSWTDYMSVSSLWPYLTLNILSSGGWRGVAFEIRLVFEGLALCHWGLIVGDQMRKPLHFPASCLGPGGLSPESPDGAARENLPQSSEISMPRPQPDRGQQILWGGAGHRGTFEISRWFPWLRAPVLDISGVRERVSPGVRTLLVAAYPDLDNQAQGFSDWGTAQASGSTDHHHPGIWIHSQPF